MKTRVKVLRDVVKRVEGDGLLRAIIRDEGKVIELAAACFYDGMADRAPDCSVTVLGGWVRRGSPAKTPDAIVYRIAPLARP